MQMNGYVINVLCCNSGGGIIVENKCSDILVRRMNSNENFCKNFKL